MSTYCKNPGNGRPNRVAGTALIAGSGNDEDVAMSCLLQGAAQLCRQRQKIRLLGGADIEDIGARI